MNAPELTHSKIAERAYQIYLANGCHSGHDLDDWLQAQYELLQQPVRELAGLEPRKYGRAAAGAALLVGVINSALLFGQMKH